MHPDCLLSCLSLGPSDLEGPIVPEVSVADKDAGWKLWQAPIEEL